jgi:3-deoxy-D-manno-octulosonate 8-phosphate phosphatase (KDO 8-P phosphatase)
MDIATIFATNGGKFITKPIHIAEKLKHIKAFVFDWDGVFNNAQKNEHKSSTFNEADSMGTNLLRFSYFLLNQHLPLTAIISGERNSMAIYFCEREHFTACYYKITDKIIALNHFCETHQIKPHQVCYVFDDVLDLSIAEAAGIRIMVNRKANPLLVQYCIKKKLVDYLTAHESGNFAVREVCELIIGLNKNYDEAVTHRKEFTETYKNYLNMRQSLNNALFTLQNNNIVNG